MVGAGSTIGRARLGGTHANEGFINAGAGSEPCGVAIYGSKLYWADEDSSTIGRGDVNGTHVQQNFIISGSNAPCGIAVG